jgi:hypothetical protein
VVSAFLDDVAEVRAVGSAVEDGGVPAADRAYREAGRVEGLAC